MIADARVVWASEPQENAAIQIEGLAVNHGRGRL